MPESWDTEDWLTVENKVAASMKQHSRRKIIQTRQGHTIEYDEMEASKSKQVLDGIDLVLAKHYCFAKEELDFILNYHIKYRMGNDEGEDEG